MAIPTPVLDEDHRDDPVVERLIDAYARFRPELVRRCRRIVGEAALAEELAQEAFARALERRHTLDLDRPVEAWLTTVGTRLALDAVRRRRPESEQLDPEHAGDDITSEDVCRRDARLRIGRALRALPERHRRAIVMYGVEGRTYAEIAEAEGVTVSSVKMTLHRARARMRDALDVRELFGAIPLLNALIRRWPRRRRVLAGGSVAGAAARVSFGIAGAAAAAGLALGTVAIVSGTPAVSVRTDQDHQAGGAEFGGTPAPRTPAVAGLPPLTPAGGAAHPSLTHDPGGVGSPVATDRSAAPPGPCRTLQLAGMGPSVPPRVPNLPEVPPGESEAPDDPPPEDPPPEAEPGPGRDGAQKPEDRPSGESAEDGRKREAMSERPAKREPEPALTRDACFVA